MKGLIVDVFLALFRDILCQHIDSHFQKLHVLVITAVGKVVFNLIDPVLQLVQAVDDPGNPAPVPIVRGPL